MQLYPPARTLSGGSLFYAFDPAAVTAVLGCLVPSNMLLLVASRTFEGKTDKVCGAAQHTLIEAAMIQTIKQHSLPSARVPALRVQTDLVGDQNIFG